MMRLLLWVGIIAFSLCVILVFAFRISPWPGVLLIQYAFSQGDTQSEAHLEKHVPPGVISRANISYGPGPDDRFDINLPPGEHTAPVPAIVWVHGGAWIAGTKEGVANYLKALAGSGFATIALEYSTGFGTTYPTPVRQVNDALGYLSRHSGELGIDSNRIILAGDSAGAQLAAQVALIVSDPVYASAIDIVPRIAPNQLNAVILASGAFDLRSVDFDGDWGWFLNTVFWAYTGTKDFLDNTDFELASVQQFVGSAFPPAYITSGNGDPLEPQARRLAQTLAGFGVPVETLFFPEEHTPPLPHEYQFNLDTPEGRVSFDEIADFARARFAQ